MVYNPTLAEWGVLAQSEVHEVVDPETVGQNFKDRLANEHGQRVYGDRHLLNAADRSLTSSALFTQTIGLQRYVRSVPVGETTILEPLREDQVSTKGLTLLWKSSGARSGDFELDKDAMLDFVNEKRAVVGKAMAWSSKALRQQQHTKWDSSHYSAETVWCKGETAFDSTQHKAVPMIKGMVPGTRIPDVKDGSDDDAMVDTQAKSSHQVIVDGSALPAGSCVTEVKDDSESPDWGGSDDEDEADSPRGVVPVVSTEAFLNEQQNTIGSAQALHTDDSEWRPSLGGADTRFALREKINFNKLPNAARLTAVAPTDETAGAASASSSRRASKQKRGAEQDRLQGGDASSSGMPLKSPRQ